MKESLWGYIIIALGVVIIAILMFVQRFTNVNEEDYYLSREIMKSSMYDAVDYGTYRSTGELVMVKEKFVEVFIRRFAQSATADRTYELNFYDIYEYPPKATVRIRTKNVKGSVNGDAVDLDVDTYITGILELNKNNGMSFVISTEKDNKVVDTVTEDFDTTYYVNN